MAQTGPSTPERELLKFIEDSKAKGHGLLKDYAIKHRSFSLFSFSAWLGRISFLRDWFKKRFKRQRQQQLNIKVINKILVVCIFMLTFYFIGNLLTSISSLKEMPYLESKLKEDVNLTSYEEASISSTKPVSYYLEKVRQRDIFKMGETSPVEAAVKLPSSSIIEATQHLRLVGISWSKDPDAIIEDTQASRSFFVKTGHVIGDIKVQAILKDKVVLRYGTEEIELK